MNILASLWFVIFISNVTLESSQYLNILSYVLWVTTIIYLFKQQAQLSFFNFIVLFAYTTTGLSCLIAEFGSYYAETQWTSYLTGATPKNLTLCFFLMYGSFIGFECIKKLLPERYPKLVRLNTIVSSVAPVYILGLIAGLLYISFKYGSPNDYNVDRFYYWSNIAPSWGDYLKFNLVQASFLLGLIYAFRPQKIFLGLLLLGLISQVMVGEKFTGIFSSIVYFVTPYLIVHYRNIKLLSFKNVMVLCVITFVFLIVIYSSYAAIVGERNAADSFISRIILQSQMWWTVDIISTDSVKPYSEIVRSFFGIAEDDRYRGIFYLMSHVTPASVFEGFYDKKINFTMASLVNIIYFFGYDLSLLVAVPIGIFCGVMYGVFRIVVINYDYWIIIVFIKIHYTIVRVLTMGEMYAFTDAKFMSLCIISLVYALFICLMKRREGNYAI